MGHFNLEIGGSTVFLSPLLASQDISPNPAYLSTGENATLTCKHPSQPSAGVRWLRGILGALSSSSEAATTGSVLVIGPSNSTELAGKYTCVVEVSDGYAQTVVSCPAEVKHTSKY